MKTLLASVLLVPALAFAADLKPAQEEAQTKFVERMEKSVKAMNDKCGTKITVKSDFEHYTDATWPTSGALPDAYCSGVADAIAAMCDRPAYKKVIASKVTGLSCVIDGVKPSEKNDGSNGATLRNMSLTGGVFTYHMSKKDHANIKDNAKTTLEKALN